MRLLNTLAKAVAVRDVLVMLTALAILGIVLIKIISRTVVIVAKQEADKRLLIINLNKRNIM